MPVESSAVEISVSVTDKNSAEVLGNVTKNMTSVGEVGTTAGAKVEQSMRGIAGATGAANSQIMAMQARMKALYSQIQALNPKQMAAFNEIVPSFTRQGMSGIDAQEQALRRTLAMVDENKKAAVGMSSAYGEARIAIGALTGSGRMMEMGLGNIGARLSWMQPLWDAALPVALGVGMVAVVGQLAEGAYNLYEKFLDVDASVKEYNAELQKSRERDFGNTKSIETTRLRIDEATAAMKQYQAQVQQHQGAGEDGWASLFPVESLRQNAWAKESQDAAAQMRRQIDELRRDRMPEQQHQDNLLQIDLAHAADAQLQGQQKITAELQKQLDIHRENARYEAQEEGAYGNPVASQSFWNTGRLPGSATEDLIARKQAAAESANLARDTENQIRRIHEEAEESGLKGIALLEYQRQKADADWLREHKNAVSTVADIDRKYYTQEKNLIEQQQDETRRMQREAGSAGLTGIPRIQAEAANRTADIAGDNTLDSVTKAQRELAVHQQMDAEILTEKEAIIRRIDELTDQSASHQISAWARIESEAQRSIASLRSDIEKTYGRAPVIGPPSATQAEGQRLMQMGLAGINTNTDEQRADLVRRGEQEAQQIETESRAKSLSAERNQTAAIETEYEERTRKYRQELVEALADKKLNNDQLAALNNQYDREVVAAAQLRDAELEESARAAREKMGSEFTSFFSQMNHPLQALAHLGDKVAGEAAASVVQRVQNHYGVRGTGNTGVGLFDRIAGAPHGTHAAAAPGTTSTLGSVRSIALTQAHIEVGSASISFGGSSSVAAGSTSARTGSAGSAGESYGPGPIAVSSGGTGGSASGGGPGFAGSTMSRGSAGTRMPVATSGGHTVASAVGDIGQSMGLVAGARATFGGSGSAGSSAGSRFGLIGEAVNSFNQSHATSVANGDGTRNFNVNRLARPIGSADPNAVLAEAQSAPGAHASIDTTSTSGDAGSSNATSVLAEAQAAPGAHGSLQTNDTTGIGDANSAIGLGKEANSIWGSTGSTSQSSGSGGNGSMTGSGVGISNTLDAASGALGVFSAYEGNGGVGGALSGAMSGMQLGMAVGGPLGAAIGAAGGAIVGALGFGGRDKAEAYDKKQVRPQLAQEMQSYQTGSTDYSSAYSDMESLDTTAERTTKAWGPGAHSYYNDHIRTEIAQARGRLDQMEKAGRANYGAAPAQAAGGWDSVPRDGMAVIHARERIIPGDQNERITRAIESGARAQRMPVASSGGDNHYHIHSIDAKSGIDWLMANKHTIRAANNSSYAENSGGADAGF